MEIKMKLPDDPKLINMINKEMTEENEELRRKLVELEGEVEKRKKRDKIKVRLKPKKRNAFVEARVGNGKIKISKKTKKSDIKTGYLNQNQEIGTKNVDRLIEEKVNKILNKKSKIRLQVKPTKVTKNVVLDIPEEELPSKIENKEAVKPEKELSSKIPIEEDKPEKKPKKEVKLLVKDEKKKVKEKEESKKEEKTIFIKTAHGKIPVRIKQKEREEFLKTGYFGHSSGGSEIAALIPLIKKMMGKEEEKAPKIKGMKIPEV